MLWVFLGWAFGLATADHMISPNNFEQPSFDPCTPKRSRTIVFLFDPTVSASDQGILAVNDSLDPLRNAIVQTANLYDVAGQKALMGLGEMRTGKYQSVVDPSQISSTLDSWKETTNPWKIGIDGIVDNIMDMHQYVDLRRLFILTKQKNINPKLFNNDQQLQRLKNFGYQIMVVGFETDVSQLSLWGKTETVKTAEEFVELAINFNEGYDCPDTTTIGTETTTAYISTTPKYEYCTMNARLDIMFMIDACFSNQADVDLVYNVLTNFYSALAMTKDIRNGADFCKDESQWNQWNTRVTGQAYYKDTYKGVVPQFCQDQSAQLASTVNGLKPSTSTVTSMKTIVNRTSIFTEQKCVCRRWTNGLNPDYNVAAKQIMIWLPLSPHYSDEATEFQRTQLYSFDQYLVPYKFSQKDANVDPDSIWTKMTEIKLTTNSRKEIVQALWDLVCNITGAPGDRPIAS